MIDGVIIADANGLIQFANPAAQKLFETSNATGHTVTEIIRNHQLWMPGGAVSKRARCKAKLLNCPRAVNFCISSPSPIPMQAEACFSFRI
jgi:sensor histidine kinase regulating citrate/malate metabolism